MLDRCAQRWLIALANMKGYLELGRAHGPKPWKGPALRGTWQATRAAPTDLGGRRVSLPDAVHLALTAPVKGHEMGKA